VTIKETVFALFKDTLMNFKVYDLCKINSSDRTIELPNGSTLIFKGLDDEAKLLSLQNISDVFIEEVYECNKDVIEQLNLRMRGKAENQQIFMAFNPVSSKHWLYDYCEINPPESFFYHVSTYKDNKFLPEAYVKSLEDLLVRNPRKAEVFVKGNWGALLDDLVYPNHEVADFDVNELLQNPAIQVRCGLDMGYVDPTAVVTTLYDKENKTIYIIDEYYKRGATLDEVVQAIRDMRIQKHKIFVDSADPRAISYFSSKGIRAEGARKGKDSVKTGISFLQNHKIVCHESCKNVAAELENYVYLRDKATGQLCEDKTDHDYTHSLDAIRYAYSDLYTARKFAVIRTIF
jgi:phage terminase large subunit